MPQSDEYKWVALWGQIMGSYSPYIKDQQKQAAKDNAPLTATFLKGPSYAPEGWATLEDVSNLATLHRLAQMVADDKEAVRMVADQIDSVVRESQERASDD